MLHFSPSAITNETIAEVILQAKRAGIKLYFIEPVPVWQEHVPISMYNAIHRENDLAEKQTKSDYLNNNSSQINFVRNAEKSSITSLPVVDYFCKPNCSYASSEGKPFYFDEGHLTITGSEQLKEVFDKILLD